MPRGRTRLPAIALLEPSDAFGRTTIPGARPLITASRLRRFAHCRSNFYHRAKNGIHDPISFFHMLDALGQIKPGKAFTAAVLAKHLNETRQLLRWDSVVVGRMLNDLIETWGEVNPGREFQPLTAVRRWSGREYTMTDFPEARAVLLAALEDLAKLGESACNAQDEGRRQDRLTSPLASLPSLRRRREPTQV
jgi:hypothetical protein